MTTTSYKRWPAESRKAIEKLDTDQAFEIFNAYDTTTNAIKGRAWTITAWILTLNAGLFGFSHLLYVEHSDLRGFVALQAVIALVGVALCCFTFVSLKDHTNHLNYYWTLGNMIGAWHSATRGVVFRPKQQAKMAAETYEADDTPGFIVRLKQLNWLFLAGFVANFALMTGLHRRWISF